jgi:hypothetical protein
MDELVNLLIKYKNTVFNAAIILIALVISKNIYQNQAKEVSALIQVKEADQKKNAALEDISQLEKKFGGFRAAVNAKDMAMLMNKISDSAKGYGVKILSFKPLQDKDYGAYTNYAFDLNITSPGYHNLGKFISKLETSLELYYITNLAIIKGGKDELITASLTLNTILVKD